MVPGLRSLRDRSLPPPFVLKFYLYRATMSAGFATSIWYLYVKAQTGTFASIGLLDAVWWGSLALFEVPTGYLGDRVGRRASLVIASVVLVCAQVAMGLSETFPAFLAVFVVWAFGTTFRSGTTSAWLYDALEERLDADLYARVSGRGNTVSLVVAGVTTVAGGYLADVNMAWAYFATAGATALSIPVLLTFPRARGAEVDDDEQFTVLDALPVMREAFTRPPLRTFVLYVGLFSGVYWSVNVFIQPVMSARGFDPSALGWLFGLFSALAAVVSYNTGRIKRYVGEERWVRGVPLLLGLLYVAVLAFPGGVLVVFVAMRALKRATDSLANQYLNDRIDALGRATLLSTAALCYRLVIMPMEAVSGYVADAVGPLDTIALLGGVLLVALAVVLLVESPFSVGGGVADAEGAVAGD